MTKYVQRTKYEQSTRHGTIMKFISNIFIRTVSRLERVPTLWGAVVYIEQTFEEVWSGVECTAWRPR